MTPILSLNLRKHQRCNQDDVMGTIKLVPHSCGLATGLTMAFLLPNFDVSLALPYIPLASLTVIVTWTILRLWKPFSQNLPYPPGPPERSFLFGNWGDIPTIKPWVTYMQWGKLYGMFHLFERGVFS